MAFNFEKLEVYQKSELFVEKIFKATRSYPSTEQYGLTSQLRRAALSVPTNIAEGSNRSGKQFSHFLTIARGSVLECISLLNISAKEKFLTQASYDELYKLCESLSMMISVLKKSIAPITNSDTTPNAERHTLNAFTEGKNNV